MLLQNLTRIYGISVGVNIVKRSHDTNYGKIKNFPTESETGQIKQTPKLYEVAPAKHVKQSWSGQNKWRCLIKPKCNPKESSDGDKC